MHILLLLLLILQQQQTDITLADFNFAAAGCTGDVSLTRQILLKNIIDHDPEFILALGDFSYEDSAKCVA